MQFKKVTTTEIVVIVSFAVIFFVGINTYVGHLHDVEGTLYIPGTDSQSYKNVADWLFDKKPIEAAWVNVAKRPYFFPLILGLSAMIHPNFIILLQFLLWTATLLLVYQVLKSRIESKRVYYFLIAVYGTLISPVVITLSVMTETTAIFLVTGAIFLFNQYHFDKQPKSLYRGLALLAFLAVTKPVGMYLFVFASTYSLWILRSKFRAFVVLFLISIPVLVQIGIMATNFGLARISIAGPYNFDVKFLVRVQALAENTQIPRGTTATTRFQQVARNTPFADLDLRSYVNDVNREVVRSLKTEPLSFLKAALYTLVDNVCSGSNYIEVHRRRPVLYFLSLFQTILMTASGLIFGIITSFLLVLKVVQSRTLAILKDSFGTLFLIFSFLFIFASSSICYWQGDRLLMLSYSSLLLLISFSYEEMKLLADQLR